MKIQRPMIAVALTLVFAAGLISAAYAQGKQGGRAPRAMINDMTKNAGDIIEGATYRNTFKIKNIGNDDLQILSVRPG
jgi:hypothetical protein